MRLSLVIIALTLAALGATFLPSTGTTSNADLGIVVGQDIGQQDASRVFKNFYCKIDETRNCTDCVKVAGGWSKCTGDGTYNPCLSRSGAECLAVALDCKKCTKYSDAECSADPQAVSKFRWDCLEPRPRP